MRFPAGRPTAREPAARLGIEAWTRPGPDGKLALTVRCRRLAYGVRVTVPGFVPEDNAFSIEPGRERVLELRPTPEGPDRADGSLTVQGPDRAGGSLTALNLEVPLTIEARPA